MYKILTFIVKDDKFLILKGNKNDPQFHESFWYVVTGGVENIDASFEDAVKREVKEECGIDVYNIKPLNLTFIYNSLGKKCIEKAFVSFSNSENIVLNEENIEYRWCTLEEFISIVKWYGDKEKLRYVLKCILDNKIPFEKEEIENI